ncbi:MAG: dethiobiotin synthase [Cellvibrionaceae bacterium]
MKQFFITGTGTEVGKTWTSRVLLAAAAAKGLRTIALKPLAAGCESTQAGLRNDDAVLLQRAITETLSYPQINPVALELAIAPHIAAEQAGVKLSVAELVGNCQQSLQHPHDFALVEGAGGWRVPLNGQETLADLAIALQFPVILVVGMGLGCLNHTLLSAEAIQRDGLTLAGWVANSPGPPMAFLEQNIATLESRLPIPYLGHLPFLPNEPPESLAFHLNLDLLLVL